MGRYALFDVIATGGMASVYLGRLDGAVGFSRVVAIKRLHAHLAQDQYFREMFLTEARVAARVRHPNVVQTFDVVATGDDVSLVMEYVQGESLSWLQRECAQRGQVLPLNIAASVIVNALHGLHAAHEARDEHGCALEIVHRDVSPQNIMVGADGVGRVFDFGVARALQSSHQTRAGQVKGKVSYMAPEQIRATPLDRRADVFSAGVVLWELLCGQRLFQGPTDAARMLKVISGDYPSPLVHRPDLPARLVAVCMKALSYQAESRFPTALDFADALEGAVTLASQRSVGEWLTGMASASLSTRAELVKQVETSDVYSKLSSLAPEATEATAATGSVASATSAPAVALAREQPAAPRSLEALRQRPLVAAGALATLTALAAVVGFALASRSSAASGGGRAGAASSSEQPAAASRGPISTPTLPLAPVDARATSPSELAPEPAGVGSASTPTSPTLEDAALAAPQKQPAPARPMASKPAVSKPAAPKLAAPKSAPPKPAGGARSFRPTEL